MAIPVYSTGDVPTADEVNEFFVNVRYARKTGTETITSSSTLQNDDELFVPLEASASYVMFCYLNYSAGTAGDIKFLFRVPAGATLVGMATALIGGAASQGDNQNAPVSGNTDNTWGGLGSGSQVGTVQASVITGGTSGNLQLEWAQNSSSPTSSQVHAGSFLYVVRVG